MTTLFSFVILIISIIAHEVAHGYAADALGDPTPRLSGRLTINPLSHVDLTGSVLLPALLLITRSPIFFGWAKPVPYNPYNLRGHRYGEAAVAAAGSATNLAFALFFGLLVRYGADLGFDATMVTVAATITFMNLSLGLFNLVPFPSLDGFTVLRAVLPWRLSSSLMRIEEYIRRAGIISLILFLIVFSSLFAPVFFQFVVWLFTLLTGTAI